MPHADRIALIDGPSGRVGDLCRARTGGSTGSPPGCPPTGFGAGDRLAVWAPNVPARRRLHAGGDAASVRVVPPGSTRRWTDDEVAIQLGDAGVSVLVTVPALADRARGVRACVE